MSTILVTGASSGMGKGTATGPLRDGHTVSVVARRLEPMQDLQALGAVAVKMDITRQDDIVAAVQAITASHGGVDSSSTMLASARSGPSKRPAWPTHATSSRSTSSAWPA